MKVLLTVVACLVVACAGAVGFTYTGIYDVSATMPDNAVVYWLVHNTSEHSVNARLGDIVVPDTLDKPEVIQAGGRLWEANCQVCHGGAGIKPTHIAQGLNPQPPNLLHAGRKPRMNEVFRFIKYGVKMTAMPGFGKTMTDEQIWSLAAFIKVLPGISPADYTARTTP